MTDDIRIRRGHDGGKTIRRICLCLFPLISQIWVKFAMRRCNFNAQAASRRKSKIVVQNFFYGLRKSNVIPVAIIPRCDITRSRTHFAWQCNTLKQAMNSPLSLSLY